MSQTKLISLIVVVLVLVGCQSNNILSVTEVPATESGVPVALSATSDLMPPELAKLGRIYFTKSDDGGTWVDLFIHTTDGQVNQITTTSYGEIDPEWSPDGTKIAYYAYVDAAPRILVQDLLSNNITTFEDTGMLLVSYLNWSPDSSALVYCARRSSPFCRLEILLVETGQTYPIPVDLGDAVIYAPVWLPKL